jgi:two-component system chemotaxis response regulator CheB
MAKTILVVDDQPYLRDVQVLLLKDAGYAATALATGSEALARLPEIQPDLILLDISMPGMDGHQFLSRLRADRAWQRLPVILASGLLAEDMQESDEPDVELLPKPFNDAALLTRVRRLIGEA